MQLNELLTLERPLVIFDLETTGLGPTARICEIAYQAFRPDGTVAENSTLVNPEMTMSDEVISKHHITNEMVKDAPTFSQLAPRIAKAFTGCDFGGKNIRFDLGVLMQEMIRVRVEWSYIGALVLCADRLEQLGEPRTLSALYKRRTGKDLEEAHRALNDVHATSELIVAQLIAFETTIPRSLAKIHEMSWPGFVDAEGKFKKVNGVIECRFGKYKDKPVRSIPSDYWEWILRSDFSAEIKGLAMAFKAGSFNV
jgi:DNA polymerase III subunit epsilon